MSPEVGLEAMTDSNCLKANTHIGEDADEPGKILLIIFLKASVNSAGDAADDCTHSTLFAGGVAIYFYRTDAVDYCCAAGAKLL